MRYLIILAFALTLGLASEAQASPGGAPPCSAAACPEAICKQIARSGNGNAPRICAEAVRGKRMSAKARNCLILAGVATAGVLVGNVIGIVASNVIGRSIALNGGAACIGYLLTS